MLQKTAIELKLEIKSESIIHFLVLWSTEENQPSNPVWNMGASFT
jgi:hypothetical protein